jgi:hypothetical protein
VNKIESKQKCPVTALSVNASKIWRTLAKIERYDDGGRGEASVLLQERLAFIDRKIQVEQATHPTGALYQLGQIKQLVDGKNADEICRYIDMLSRFLVSQGGKICAYSDPRFVEEDLYVTMACKRAAEAAPQTAA